MEPVLNLNLNLNPNLILDPGWNDDGLTAVSTDVGRANGEEGLRKCGIKIKIKIDRQGAETKKTDADRQTRARFAPLVMETLVSAPEGLVGRDRSHDEVAVVRDSEQWP